MIEASCPARVDIGNTIDFPSLFLSMPTGEACTTNIAIDLRTKVTYQKSQDAYVEVNSDRIIERNIEPFNIENSKLRMVWTVLNHFNIKRGVFQIQSDIPRSSGLGGSSALLISLVSVVLKLKKFEISNQILDRILIFCHLFENWLGFSSTGFHDQLAAIHGGGNLWIWGADFSQDGIIYRRRKILSSEDCGVINERLILAFTGESHEPTRMVSLIGLSSEQELRLWHRISQLTEEFSSALESRNWETASKFLDAECDIRLRMAPERISDRASLLIGIAKDNEVGSRYVGHGYGGCVWALGCKDRIASTFTEWKIQTDNWVDAWTIYPGMASKGLVVNEQTRDNL